MVEAAEILARAMALAGTAAEETQKLEPIAKLCASRLMGRLKLEVDDTTAENREALVTAGAGMLLYQQALLAHYGGCESFHLGDFSVSSGGQSIEQVRALKNELMAGAAALLLPEDAYLIQAGEA